MTPREKWQQAMREYREAKKAMARANRKHAQAREEYIAARDALRSTPELTRASSGIQHAFDKLTQLEREQLAAQTFVREPPRTFPIATEKKRGESE